MRLDGAVVQLYQRARQVQSDACTDVTVVGTRWRLIEAFKDAFQLVLRYLLTIVEDVDDGLFLALFQ